MSETYRTSRIVQWYDTDAAAIAHFTAFFRWMEETEHEFLRHVGLSVSVPDEDGSISFPRVSVGCDYHSAVKFEDIVDLTMRITRIGAKSISFEYDVTSAGRTVATIRATAVCCRIRHGQPPTGIPIPSPMLDKLAPYCQSTSS